MHPQPSRRQRVAPLIELRIQKWWEVLVTLQSSLPACLKTPDLQAGSRITSHIDNGSGGGSCAHGGRAYEARLNLILPAVKWWSRRVSRPHQPACRAGALLVCHDPMNNGRPPRCCPERTEFWRLCRASWRAACGDWCGCRESHPDMLLGKEPFCC